MGRPYDIGALELLVAVGDTGSLGAAARATGTAQPNASRTIARLERAIGTPLIQRSPQGSTLTAAGLVVVDLARGVVKASLELDAGLSALQGSAPAALHVMASQTVAEYLLPQWLPRWRLTHPDAGLAVSVGNTTDVVAAVRAGTTTIGFIEGPDSPHELNSCVVGHDTLQLVAAPGLPLASRTSISADELAATPLVTREAGSGTRVALERALAPRPLAPPVLELGSNSAVRVSATAGTGPAVLSNLAVTAELHSGALTEVPVTGVDLRRSLRAIWSGPRRLPDQAAEDFLRVAASATRGAPRQ